MASVANGKQQQQPDMPWRLQGCQNGADCSVHAGLGRDVLHLAGQRLHVHGPVVNLDLQEGRRKDEGSMVGNDLVYGRVEYGDANQALGSGCWYGKGSTARG